MSTVPAWVRPPERAPGEPPLFLHELLAAAHPGTRVLDAGCGPGSWDYDRTPSLRVVGFDIKFPPGPPRPGEGRAIFRADLARLPLAGGTFGLTLCHYVLEHVTALGACCDELVRVTAPEGLLYLSVPRAASFDDRLYRFAGYFAKFALMKFRKQIEHQQRFDFEKLVNLFAERGLGLTAWASVPAGFSWMNDPRTKRLQIPFTNTLAWVHRVSGIDLARDANFIMTFRRGADGSPAVRRVTHVCRECGEHSVLTPPRPLPATWSCPWCGKTNPLGRPR